MTFQFCYPYNLFSLYKMFLYFRSGYAVQFKLLKGSVSRDFWPPFLYDSNPSRPLINRLKVFSNSVSILPRYLNLASLHGVKLRGAHHTAESDSAVFYKCYFSVMPEDINITTILWVTNCIRNLFYFRSFSNKWSWKSLQIQKHEKRTFSNFSSLTPQCASHRGVELHCVHPTLSQTPRCASHHGVK